MLKVLTIVNWPICRVKKFEDAIRNPDQLISGQRYWFSKYWPSNVIVDVVGIQQGIFFDTFWKFSRIHLQSLKTFSRIKEYDLILTYDSSCAFLFALLRSKLGFCRSIPHVMVDVGMPRAVEPFFKNVPPSLVCEILRQVFNPKSVSCIIFHSMCQQAFYRDILGFSDDALSYVPFGVETEYFKPESLETEDYIYASGEFRDFNTILRVYEKRHKDLPELRIRSALPSPDHLPPKVKWLPRASISTFRIDVLKSRFVIVPLPYTIRSTGLMTCLQSMALGKAILTSRVPPIYGYVTNRKTAIYYEPYDENDLFRKISLLLENDKLVKELGENARMEVEAKFTVQNYGIQLWNCVSSALQINHN